MSLNWNWKDKIGTMTVVQSHPGEEDQTVEISLYQGNAFLIMIHEYQENGQEMYSMYSFFADKQHAKNCLGLNKKQNFGDNIFDTPYVNVKKFRINKKKYRYTKDLVPLLVEAFGEVDIEIFSEEEQENG